MGCKMKKKMIGKTELVALINRVLKSTLDSANSKNCVSDDANRKDIYMGMVIGIRKVKDTVMKEI